MEFKANRYSTKLKELQKQIKVEKKVATSRKIDEAVAKSNGTAAWLKKVDLLLHPDGNGSRINPTLPEHKEQGLTTFEQAQDYANHISKISRDYTPLSRTSLPERVLHALDNAVCGGRPHAEDHEVFTNLSKGNLHQVFLVTYILL